MSASPIRPNGHATQRAEVPIHITPEFVAALRRENLLRYVQPRDGTLPTGMGYPAPQNALLAQAKPVNHFLAQKVAWNLSQAGLK